MKKTKNYLNEKRLKEESICVTREGLATMLGCGQMTADRIAAAAGARIRMGKRVLIKLSKINDYLENVAE